MATTGYDERIAVLADRAEIGDLILEFARCIDDSDQAGYAATFDEQCELILPFARVVGRAAIEAMPSPQPGMRTHHQISNILFDIDGDSARTRAYLTATHVFDATRPTDTAQAGGWYLHELVRTAAGWRFRRVELVIVWETAEPMIRDAARPAPAHLLNGEIL